MDARIEDLERIKQLEEENRQLRLLIKDFISGMHGKGIKVRWDKEREKLVRV